MSTTGPDSIAFRWQRVHLRNNVTVWLEQIEGGAPGFYGRDRTMWHTKRSVVLGLRGGEARYTREEIALSVTIDRAAFDAEWEKAK